MRLTRRLIPAPRPLRLALPLALLAVLATIPALTRRIEAGLAAPWPVVHTVPYRPAISTLAAGTDQLAGELPMALHFEPGETVAEVLAGLGLAPAEAATLIAELESHADLRRLRPADSYVASHGGGTALARFELTVAGKGRATVASRDGGWHGSWRPFERSVTTRAVRGELRDALESSVRAAGADVRLAYRLADVFQWDLDFNRDLRLGDRWEALYEEVHLDGRYEAPGSVLAATYTNGGRTLEAYRFGDPPGYYDAEGRPMRKMFLRSPLSFSRVTSRFSARRFHPILKRYRPHYGVDYGAPSGTPVRATAGGVVVSAGWEGGGGRTVKIRHPNDYLTAYLHLSRYAVSSGRRVAQGEVIGYVGSSGLATASHLDYRVQHRGRWVDPLSLKSVPTQPLPEERLGEYLAWRDALRLAVATGAPFEAPAPVPVDGAVVAEGGVRTGAGAH